MAKHKHIEVKVKLEDCFDSSFVSDLAEEMTEWRDNLDGTGLENTSKYETVSEAADTLDNALSSLESALDAAKAAFEDNGLSDRLIRTTLVSWSQPYGKHQSRATRMGIGLAHLQAIVDAVHDIEDDDTVSDDAKSTLQDACGELEDIISDLDGVEFPGMFG